MTNSPNDPADDFRELIHTDDEEKFAELIDQHPHALAEGLQTLEDEVMWDVLRRIPSPQDVEVFSHLEPELQVRLVEGSDTEEAVALVNEMAPDDQVDLLRELDPEVRLQVMDGLDKETRQVIERLATYEEGTAGSVMNTQVVSLRADQTVADALDHLRHKASDNETIYYNYVVDSQGKLLGIVSIRALILSPPDTKIADLMNTHVITARVNDDQNLVAKLIREYDLLAIPILHGDDRLAGVVTVDDAIDVTEEEATEDFHRMASVGVITTGLREASTWLLYRKRIPWLLGLVFFNIFSGAGIAFFEDTIVAYAALVFFLPLLIDSGGNAGAQSSTLMIRAMATGDVRTRDWLQLLLKEMSVSILIGATMAVGVSLIGIFRAPEVAVVVAATLICTVFVGSVVGMLLPFLLARLKLDPATASAPLITSVADICGVLIYFGIATWYLGIGTVPAS